MELQTPRFRLRRLRAGDEKSVWAYRSLPEVARFQSWDFYTLDDAARLATEQTAVVPDTVGTWLQLAIVELDSGEIIGDCGIHFRSEEFSKDAPGQIELGITLAPSHQGQGAAQETLKSVLDYAFGTLKKHRAVAVIDARNHASARLFERLRFRREAHFIDHIWFKDEWGSELLFAMLQREWPSQPNKLTQVGEKFFNTEVHRRI